MEARRPRSTSRILGSFSVVALLIAGLGPAIFAASVLGEAGQLRSEPPGQELTALGTSAALDTNRSSVPEGMPVSFSLTIAPFNCSQLGPKVTFQVHLGDGFSLVGPNTEGVVQCTGTFSALVAFTYSYHLQGIVEAWASANGTGLGAVRSNTVTLDITAPPDEASGLSLEWAVGGWTAVGAGICLAYMVRRFFRRPPSLPVHQV